MQDVDSIMALVSQRIDWMNLMGLHQWNDTDYFGRYPRSYWQEHIDSFLVGEDDERIVVAIALYKEDVRWTSDGEYTGSAKAEDEEAFYLHHLVTDPSFKGVGAAMMQFVERYARENGVKILRLDSAVGNQALEWYYNRLGYTACGTCHDQLYHGILREKIL